MYLAWFFNHGTIVVFLGTFQSRFICCWWALLQSHCWGIKSMRRTCPCCAPKYWSEIGFSLDFGPLLDCFLITCMALLYRVMVLISNPMFIQYIMPSWHAWQTKTKTRLAEFIWRFFLGIFTISYGTLFPGGQGVCYFLHGPSRFNIWW